MEQRYKYFRFVRGMQPRRGGEEGFNNFKKQPLSNIRGGKLAFGICCPSSQNKTQILGGHRGREDRIRPAPLDSSGGHRVRTWGGVGGGWVMVSGGC